MDTNLPTWCYTNHPEDGRLVLIVRGESGYREADPHDVADMLNEQIGVTDEEVQCMTIGSMFGWEVPGAQLKKESDDD